MKTVFLDAEDGYLWAESYSSRRIAVPVSDEGYALVCQWAETPYPEDRHLSGVLADWVEENLTLTPELERTVRLLRRRFASSTFSESLEVASDAP